jgi:hypothetical protein
MLLIIPIPDYAQLPTNNDPYHQIRFNTLKGAEERRDELIRFIWNDGIPTGVMPEITPNVTTEALDYRLKHVNKKLVKSIDEWRVEVFGITSLIYNIKPVQTMEVPSLAIVHAGHGPLEGTYLKKNYRSAIEFFLERGYHVVMVHMPMRGWNDDYTVIFPDEKNEEIYFGDYDNPHGPIIKLVDLDTTLEAGAGFRPFLEPVVACINYWNRLCDVNPDVTMIGLSGGGWTTHMLAAIDTRIKLSFPVAGSYPLYLRNGSENKAHLGDLEQYYEPLYNEDIASDGTGGGMATWLEIYALGGSGEHRKQIMITSRYDECCFFGDPKKTVDTFKSVVKDKVEELGAGSWIHELDTTHREHIISQWMLDYVVKPSLPLTN